MQYWWIDGDDDDDDGDDGDDAITFHVWRHPVDKFSANFSKKKLWA